MSRYLRLTPEQYVAILRACPSGAHDDAGFRDALASALAGTDPGLACYVAGLRSSQARLLREHVEPAPEAGDWALELTVGEWRALARASELARLGGPRVTPGELLRLVEGESPALAAKLEAMAPARLAMLCYSLGSGVGRTLA
jgi:hypothetical protein